LAKTKTIENLFVYFAIYCDFLPIILYFLSWKKNKPYKDLRIIIAYCLFDFVVNTIMGFSLNTKLQITLYDGYTLFEFLFFAKFIHYHIQSKSFRKIILIVSCAFAAFIIYFNLNAKYRGFDSIPIGIETILILLFAFYFLFEQMKDTQTLFIYSKYSFWIVLGMMMYLAGGFFIYIFASQVGGEEIGKYWFFTNIFSIIKNILFAIAISITSHHSRQKKNSLKFIH
jgi:hypothetical protein